jgi:hypothetical protein
MSQAPGQRHGRISVPPCCGPAALRYFMNAMGEQDLSIEQVMLEANIREFGHTISLICALEVGGRISSDEAYKQIKKTWQELKLSRKSLFLGDKKS